MNPINVSFITINYNSSKYTLELLESIKEHTKNILYEVIIIDNASKEEDIEFLESNIVGYPFARLIKNKINSGFASGNMLGVNYANGEYYFFINNDCKLLNNTALILQQFLESNKDVALVTAQIIDDNGNFFSSYKQFPHILKQLFGNSVQRNFSKYKFPSNKIKLENSTAVEVVTGSCMFFRANEFAQIGGFDTVFFLYCEEEDICKRVWDIGKKVYFIPKAQVYHKSGGSTSSNVLMEKEFYISYHHLIKKHNSNFGVAILLFSLFWKLFLRIFKKEDGMKIFLFFIKGLNSKESLRYKQKIRL